MSPIVGSGMAIDAGRFALLALCGTGRPCAACLLRFWSVFDRTGSRQQQFDAGNFGTYRADAYRSCMIALFSGVGWCVCHCLHRCGQRVAWCCHCRCPLCHRWRVRASRIHKGALAMEPALCFVRNQLHRHQFSRHTGFPRVWFRPKTSQKARRTIQQRTTASLWDCCWELAFS